MIKLIISLLVIIFLTRNDFVSCNFFEKAILGTPSESYELSEDGKLNFTGLARKYGFECEEHIVVTSDGYILMLFHIPGNASRPMLLTHGSTLDADCWILRGLDSPALVLAKMGYDIWAVSLRGTRYSRNHLYLNPDFQADAFFDFTFYDEGIHDLRVTIDYVLKETRQPSLTAISHSQGTSSLYVLCAERPEYNEKIKLMVSLAPIASIRNVRGIVGALKTLESYIGYYSFDNGAEIIGYYQTRALVNANCLGYDFKVQQCRQAILHICGLDEENLEEDYMTTFLGHFPGGTTFKNVEYTLQQSEGKGFRKFDFGPSNNFKEYGTEEPPYIDLNKVTMKVALMVGPEDFLSTVKDVQFLRTALPNIVEYIEMPYSKFNHLDFIVGRNMDKIFYPYLLEVLEKHEN